MMYDTDKEKEDFYLVRPILEDMQLDKYGIPTIRALHENEVDIENLIPTNFQNLRKGKSHSKNLILNFSYDKKIDRQWNSLLDGIPLLTGCGAVCSLDYSISPQMSPIWFKQYIFRSHYAGALWQHFNIKVVPTISWCYEDTYEICFSSTEPGGIVIVSGSSVPWVDKI